MRSLRPAGALASIFVASLGAWSCVGSDDSGPPSSLTNEGGLDVVAPLDSGSPDSSALDSAVADATAADASPCKPGSLVTDGGACVDVAGSLSGLRWDLPCTGANADPSLCAAASTPVVKTATLAGASGSTYSVTLRFRGTIEPNAYSGGAATGYFYTGGAASDPYANIYELAVSDPPQTFFVNSGAVRQASALYCDAIDYTATVDVRAGATITLTGNPRDALQIKNRDQAGAPLVIAGIPPAPAAFDGQFVQMDVLTVVAK